MSRLQFRCAESRSFEKSLKRRDIEKRESGERREERGERREERGERREERV